MSKSIVLIQFSSREKGNCSAISEYISAYYVKEKTTKFTITADTVTACNDCDYECLQPDKVCPKLYETNTAIMDAICNADLVYFIVPNYCGYPSANYFAFNERTVGYFNMDSQLLEKYMSIPKRFIAVSNSEENFENAFQQQVNEKPEILYMKTGNYHKRSIAGDMMDASEANEDLKAFLDRYNPD